MASNVQTYSQTGAGYNTLTAEQAEFYQRTMLEALYDNVCFMPYGDKKNIPKNNGALTSWRRMELPTLSTNAVVEGTTPDAINLSINKVNATVSQYGAWTKISDFLDLTGLDPVLTETSKLFGDHAGLSMDTIVRDIIAAGTNVTYANGKTSRTGLVSGDKISDADILKIRKTMVKNNVKPLKLPNGGKGFLAFVSPDIANQIMQLQSWKDQNTYVDVKNREQGIVGQMYGIFFKEATTAKVFANASGDATPQDVHATLVIGKGAYGIPDVDGSSKPEIIVHSNGSTENPMNLYQTVAWKSAFTAVRLNEKCILRYESVLN